MKSSILCAVLLAGPALGADVSHPVIELIRLQPTAGQAISSVAEIGVLKPELLLKGLAALAQAAPSPLAHLNAASGASVAVLALAARPELFPQAQSALQPNAAQGLANISRKFQEFADAYPEGWGRALARAKAVSLSADQGLERLGPKLLEIFDGGQAPRQETPSQEGPSARRFVITSLGVAPWVRADDMALILKDPRIKILSQEGRGLIVEATLHDLHPYSDLFDIKLPAPENSAPARRPVTLEIRLPAGRRAGPFLQDLLEDLHVRYGVSIDVAKATLDPRSGSIRLPASTPETSLDELRSDGRLSVSILP